MTGETVLVTINGDRRTMPAGMTVERLLERLEAAPAGIAVAKNGHVVQRSSFGRERIDDGDRIEIIKAVAGG
ncbi:MAG: sulfur carrier protein ThiS [Vulcanimicrobiaceae bacterium]